MAHIAPAVHFIKLNELNNKVRSMLRKTSIGGHIKTILDILHNKAKLLAKNKTLDSVCIFNIDPSCMPAVAYLFEMAVSRIEYPKNKWINVSCDKKGKTFFEHYPVDYNNTFRVYIKSDLTLKEVYELQELLLKSISIIVLEITDGYVKSIESDYCHLPITNNNHFKQCLLDGNVLVNSTTAGSYHLRIAQCIALKMEMADVIYIGQPGNGANIPDKQFVIGSESDLVKFVASVKNELSLDNPSLISELVFKLA